MKFLWLLVSLILSLAWIGLSLRVGVRFTESQQGTWRNCAVIAGIAGAIFVGNMIGLLVSTAIGLELLTVVISLGGVVLLIETTSRILDIHHLMALGLWAAIGIANWVLMHILDLLRIALPLGRNIIVDWAPF